MTATEEAVAIKLAARRKTDWLEPGHVVEIGGEQDRIALEAAALKTDLERPGQGGLDLEIGQRLKPRRPDHRARRV